ncbi:MAG: hypothetical protein N2035_06345 [Chthoniobacterales bacterium]|nr:hypothetical protein [Chthoniobacterales bacterium]
MQRELEESGELHMREEMGVNPITAPLIRNLLRDLDTFRPIPLDLIQQNPLDPTFTNRRQTAMHFGTLVADGFLLTLAERSEDVQAIGRALLRHAATLGVGERLASRAKSLLEKSSRGDWNGMKEELIQAQAEVEEAMMELRDEEIAHFVSFGGYIRGLQLATASTARVYSPAKANALYRPEVLDYFLERFSTLHPRLRSTEFIGRLLDDLQQIRLIQKKCESREPSPPEVEKMNQLAQRIFLLIVSPISEDGHVVGPPQLRSRK